MRNLADLVRLWDRLRGRAVCRVCGCTDNAACPGGCSWVEPDLCSACAFVAEGEEGDPVATRTSLFVVVTRIEFMDGTVELIERPESVRLDDGGWVVVHGYDPEPEPAGMTTTERCYSPHAVRSVTYEWTAPATAQGRQDSHG